jgi:formylmethanofuran dehydrogenase subunit E
MSCAIDGLQVSLGSTLAQDLIHVRSVAHPQVAGVFEYKGHRVRLSLKPEFQKQVDDTISATVKECGDLTPAYFERVEVASYRVWAEFDRSAIFVEEELKP